MYSLLKTGKQNNNNFVSFYHIPSLSLYLAKVWIIDIKSLYFKGKKVLSRIIVKHVKSIFKNKSLLHIPTQLQSFVGLCI